MGEEALVPLNAFTPSFSSCRAPVAVTQCLNRGASHGHFWSKRIEHKRLSKIHLRSDEYESQKNCPDHMQRRQGILDNSEAILEHGSGRSGCANRQSPIDRALPGPGRSIADHDSTHGAQQGDPDPHWRSVALYTDAQE